MFVNEPSAEQAAWVKEFRRFCGELITNGYPLEPLPNRAWAYTQTADNWNDFLRWSGALNGNWGFRGQSQSNWTLAPSMDRIISDSLPHSFYKFDYSDYEADVLFRFKQQAHRYVSRPPPERDLVSWFALMQHRGAPTRLLDWTLSAHIAAFFATETEMDESAVWAIDLDWLEHHGNQLLRAKGKSRIPIHSKNRAQFLNELLSNPPAKGLFEKKDEAEPMIVRVDPFETDGLIAAQMGFFLCKTHPDFRFDEQLINMLLAPSGIDHAPVRMLLVKGNLRFVFLKELRNINITRATLFPDLDGFAGSLKLDMQINVDDEKQLLDLTPDKGLSHQRQFRMFRSRRGS